MNTTSLAEGEAGQSASLIPLLQSLLHDYEPGVGIAKEFIQNADDAGASRVRFALDLRHHSTKQLPNSRMNPLVGPALLISSDQTFLEEDLKRIQTISEGAKRNQPAKTGRFGLGFNTCYHITDYPCFATRDRITCFDPHRDVAASSEGKPGRWWSLQKSWAEHPDLPRAFDLPQGVNWATDTIFRLPLRTSAQASPSRLRNRPFLESEAFAIFDDLERWGGSLLLFLRKILHLEVDILHPDGRVESRLRVITSDPDRVQMARSHLVDADNTAAWLLRWRSGNAELQEAVYEHRFRVTSAAGQHDEHFLVAGALVPEGKALLDAANAMDEGHGRVLPWIGAAVSLAPADKAPPPRVKERLFCTLPLSQGVNIPFFLNGAFDLDSSRIQITYNARNGDREVRSRWNKALLTEAAPHVIVNLFSAARERLGDRYPSAFYALWPEPQEAGPMEDFVQAVYLALAKGPFLRVSENGIPRWVSSLEARAPGTWSDALREAMLADGLALLDPPPPPYVLSGLANAASQPKAWTADEMCLWLRVEIDPDCRLEDARRAVLRHRNFVLELAQLYGDGKAKVGLPLALMADGQLRAFHRGTDLFIASPEIQQLFPHKGRLFLEATFAVESGLRPDPSVKLFDVDARVVVEWVCELLQPSPGRPWRDWASSSQTPPSVEWLQDVLRYLSGHDLRAYRSQLRAACLLPDEHDRLHRADSLTPPLYLRDGTPEPLASALRAFGVPILSSRFQDLVALLGLTSRKMLAPNGTDLLPLLNADAVAHALTPGSALEDQPDARCVMLDWLSDEHRLKPLSRITLERVRSLKLWPDEHGELAAASDRPLYLPTGYEPPHHLPKYRLLRCGQADRWLSLLRALGVPALHLSVVIEAVITQVEQSRDDLQIRDGLRWLRNEAHHGQVEAVEGEKRANEVRAKLRYCSIFPSKDGRRHALKDLYHPDDEETVEVLGSLAHHPLLSALIDHDDERGAWLKWMTLQRTPSLKDLLARIIELQALSQASGPASVEKDLLRVLQYLDSPERWKSIREKRVSGRTSNFAQLLASLQWLPAVREEPKTPGFVSPDLRLYQPSQVYPASLRNQVASQAPLLALWPHEKLCDDLRIPTKVPLPIVLAHLRFVRDLWDQPDHGGVAPKLVSDLSQEILSRIAQPSPREASAQDQSALASLAAEPCVWHLETQRFWKPAYIFLQSIPGLEPLRVHIDAPDAIRKGLLRLGVRAEPEAMDYVSFLHELSESHKGRALPEGMMRNVLWAWQRLSEHDDEAALRERPAVLTRDGRLADPTQVLEDDAPWWSTRLRNEDLYFLAPGVPRGAARIAGVRSAAGEIEEVLLAEGTAPSLVVRGIASTLEAQLAQRGLQTGLLRLLAHAHDLTDLSAAEGSATHALKVSVVAASSLKTGLTCLGLDRVGPFGEGEADSFLDGDRLLLALDDSEPVAHEVATVINRRLADDLRLKDLSALEAIIRCRPEKIEEVLDRRRIRPLQVEREALDLRDLDPRGDEATPDEADDPETVRSGGHHSPDPTRLAGPRSPEGYPIAQNQGVGHAGSQVLRPAPADTDSQTLRPIASTSTSGSAPGHSPLTPGDGTSHVAKRQNDGRLRSYASPTGSPMNVFPSDTSVPKFELQRAAVEYVLEAARECGWRAEGRTTGHAGQGLSIEVPGEVQPRHVVVKGLSGAWNRTGISLTKDEVRDAQDRGEHYWIYVVEHALDAERIAIVPIQDPWGKLDELRFDDGWRETAATSSLQVPSVGLLLYEGEDILGEIVEIASMGPLQRLTIRRPEGQPHVVYYNPSLHQLIVQESFDGENDT